VGKFVVLASACQCYSPQESAYTITYCMLPYLLEPGKRFPLHTLQEGIPWSKATCSWGIHPVPSCAGQASKRTCIYPKHDMIIVLLLC
jgi:hypothetical protein